MRTFVRRETRLRPVLEVPGLRLHLAEDVTELWHRVGAFMGQDDPHLPYWAFTWSGGLAIARHIMARPDEVAGKDVIDIGSGSGLGAIVALRLGARAVHAFDIDPLAEAAVDVNSRAAGVRPRFSREDILDEPPPAVDVVLAGDVWYEKTMSGRMIAWLSSAASNGTRVLVGDPGRGYTPPGLELVARFDVQTSREVERLEVTSSTVYTIARNPRRK